MLEWKTKGTQKQLEKILSLVFVLRECPPAWWRERSLKHFHRILHASLRPAHSVTSNISRSKDAIDKYHDQDHAVLLMTIFSYWNTTSLYHCLTLTQDAGQESYQAPPPQPVGFFAACTFRSWAWTYDDAWSFNMKVQESYIIALPCWEMNVRWCPYLTIGKGFFVPTPIVWPNIKML